MLLLEHLISLARSRGLHAFTAETLSENALMLKVFADAGLEAHRALADGVYDLTFPLPSGGRRRARHLPRGGGRARTFGRRGEPPAHAEARLVAVIGANRPPGRSGGRSCGTS